MLNYFSHIIFQWKVITFFSFFLQKQIVFLKKGVGVYKYQHPDVSALLGHLGSHPVIGVVHLAQT